jgi:hypothetical protein
VPSCQSEVFSKKGFGKSPKPFYIFLTYNYLAGLSAGLVAGGGAVGKPSGALAGAVGFEAFSI